MADIARKQILERLLENEKWSDLAIVCDDGEVFKVHKAIVCERSPMLARKCAASDVHEHQYENHRGIMHVVVQYLYGLELEIEDDEPCDYFIEDIGNIFDAAKEYEVPELGMQVEATVLDIIASRDLEYIIGLLENIQYYDTERQLPKSIIEELLRRTTMSINEVMANGKLWSKLRENDWMLRKVMMHFAESSNKSGSN